MFGRLKRGIKWLRLLMKVEKIWKEEMMDKPMKNSMTVWGAALLALIPISALVLPAIGLPDLVAPVGKILAGLAALIGGIGLRRLAGKALVANGKTK